MIIDFRMTPPLKEYLTLEEAKVIIPATFYKGYHRVYHDWLKVIPNWGTPKEVSVESVIRDLDEAGIEKAVLHAEWSVGDHRKVNDAAYRMAKAYPNKFPVYYMCVNPLVDQDMAKVVEREVKERGFSGVNMQGFAPRLRVNDKRFYPLWAKCQELGLVVAIHSSVNFLADAYIDFSRPIYLDEVACDFPDLKIVAMHGGWPWVTEMVAIAWKHPNVYIETGAISPKYIGMSGTGWEPLMRYGNSVLQDQVLFATDGLYPKRLVEEMKALPLKDTVKEKWLGGNAARLLGLKQRK